MAIKLVPMSHVVKSKSAIRYEYNRKMAQTAREEMIALGIITPVEISYELPSV